MAKDTMLRKENLSPMILSKIAGFQDLKRALAKMLKVESLGKK